MSTIINETEILNMKGNLIAALHGIPVQVTQSQEDLGILVYNCPTSRDNSNKQRPEKRNAVYQLKERGTLGDKTQFVYRLSAAHCHLCKSSLDAKNSKHATT